MRATSHVGTMPAPATTEASSSLVAGISPHRRVMRAAWALHRSQGGLFADALKEAWRHEKAQSGLSAARALHGAMIETAYLNGSIGEIISAFPVEDYYYYARETRLFIVSLIERLMAVLDVIDGDPDEEPILGAPELISDQSRYTSQDAWCSGSLQDIELLSSEDDMLLA